MSDRTGSARPAPEAATRPAVAPPEPPPQRGALTQIGWILWKDLLVEWRGRARTTALATYAVTLLLLFSFSIGPNTQLLRELAPAYLWLAILSASTLLLAQSFQLEVESGAIDGLLLAPTRPGSIFFGKAIANTALLTLLGLICLLIGLGLFDLQPRGSFAVIIGGIALGCAGLSAPGTLYAALTARLPSQQLMLPVLLFPLVVPTLLASVKVTGLQLQGDPMGQTGSWTMLLVCFNLVYWSLGGVLFGRVVQE